MTPLHRIAVADDEPIIRDFYCKVLHRKGLSVVVTACDGKELVDGCRRENPDLIICDIRMPKLDGLSALHSISQFRRTPAIVITALSESQWQQHAGRELVLTFLIKPVGIRELEDAITQAQQRLQHESAGHP